MRVIICTKDMLFECDVKIIISFQFWMGEFEF